MIARAFARAAEVRAQLPAPRNPFKRHPAVPLTPKQFHYTFANTLSQEESDEIRDRYHLPCAVTVLRESAFASLHQDPPTKVDFTKDDRAPMLLIAFEHDHIILPSVARHNVEKYGESKAVTEFKEFPDRPHFPGVPGYEGVADYAIEWVTQHATTREIRCMLSLTVTGPMDNLSLIGEGSVSLRAVP